MDPPAANAKASACRGFLRICSGAQVHDNELVSGQYLALDEVALVACREQHLICMLVLLQCSRIARLAMPRFRVFWSQQENAPPRFQGRPSTRQERLPVNRNERRTCSCSRGRWRRRAVMDMSARGLSSIRSSSDSLKRSLVFVTRASSLTGFCRRFTCISDLAPRCHTNRIDGRSISLVIQERIAW